MIYVECKPDSTLIRHITGLGRRAVSEAKGKGEVCRKLATGRNDVGVVDEDPTSRQPNYIARLTPRTHNAALGLRTYRDTARNNLLIVICPRLEDWLLRAVRDAGLRMADYGLPDRSDRLHKVINEDERKIIRLLTDLTEANSPRLAELRRLLSDAT